MCVWCWLRLSQGLRVITSRKFERKIDHVTLWGVSFMKWSVSLFSRSGAVVFENYDTLLRPASLFSRFGAIYFENYDILYCNSVILFIVLQVCLSNLTIKSSFFFLHIFSVNTFYFGLLVLEVLYIKLPPAL